MEGSLDDPNLTEKYRVVILNSFGGKIECCLYFTGWVYRSRGREGGRRGGREEEEENGPTKADWSMDVDIGKQQQINNETSNKKAIRDNRGRRKEATNKNKTKWWEKKERKETKRKAQTYRKGPSRDSSSPEEDGLRTQEERSRRTQ